MRYSIHAFTMRLINARLTCVFYACSTFSCVIHGDIPYFQTSDHENESKVCLHVNHAAVFETCFAAVVMVFGDVSLLTNQKL